MERDVWRDLVQDSSAGTGRYKEERKEQRRY
jgi:hypothetical protein